jgi:hypothetical protein
MSASKRLAAHRASASAEDPEVPATPANPDETETPTIPGKKDDDMPTEEEMKAAAEAASKTAPPAGFKAANERLSKVLGSDHYAGREALAQSLLASEALSADDIIGHLEKAPKSVASTDNTSLTAEEQRAAAEEAGRKEMQAALEKNTNSNIDASTGKDPKADARKKTDDVWDRAAAKVQAHRKGA